MIFKDIYLKIFLSSSFRIYHFLLPSTSIFILHSIHRFLLFVIFHTFHTFHFSFLQFPTSTFLFPIFQFQYLCISLLLHFLASYLYLSFLSNFYHSLFTIILIIRFPPCILNMQISFSTQQPFTFHHQLSPYFFNLRATWIEITFNRYQTCLHPPTLKHGKKLKKLKHFLKLKSSNRKIRHFLHEPVPGSKDSSSFAREHQISPREPLLNPVGGAS